MPFKKSIILGLVMTANVVQPVFSDRLLYIFGDPENKFLVEQQIQLMKNRPVEIKERALKVIKVAACSSLYQAYQIKPGRFMVVLVGKDGTEKYRTNVLLQPAELFALIDAMPMRQEEMRKKQK